MSQSWTIDALLAARDLALCLRPGAAQLLIDEVQPDFAYVRCSCRALRVPMFFLDDGPGEYDYEEWEPAPLAEQIAAHRAEVRAIDWLAWRTIRPLDLTSLDSIIKEHYSVTDYSVTDVTEMRIRSYANLISHRPG